MSDIFISYKSSDRERVQPLVDLLKKQGLSVWWDHQSIPLGERFDGEIAEAIKVAKCLIVIWSNESINSEWVREEAFEGLTRDILVPVLIDEVEIPFGFRRVQAARLIDWDGEGGHQELTKIFSSIEKKLNRRVHYSPPRSIANSRRKWIAGSALTICLVLGGFLIYKMFDKSPPPVVNPEVTPSPSIVSSEAVTPALNNYVADDPQKNQWGGKEVNNGRRIRADVTSIPGDAGWFKVAIYVESVDPVNIPLAGEVIFHLHPTFAPDQHPVIPVSNGKAVLNRRAWGAFTVGAEADKGKTKLELDLSKIEDAPILFRSR